MIDTTERAARHGHLARDPSQRRPDAVRRGRLREHRYGPSYQYQRRVLARPSPSTAAR